VAAAFASPHAARPAHHVRELCVVPIALVSDHLESLGEIDHEAREEAYRLGSMQFEMSCGLNDSAKIYFCAVAVGARGPRRRLFSKYDSSEWEAGGGTAVVGGGRGRVSKTSWQEGNHAGSG
jgi:Ferrochelatase